MRNRLSVALFVTLLAAHAAHAQKEDPAPPGSSDDEAPPSSSPTSSTTPAARVKPATTGATTTSTAASSSASFRPDDWKNAIGVYGRYLFVTAAMLHPYLTHATSLNSYAVGLTYTRRFEHFDIVTTLDFSWMSPQNGNYLSGSGDPTVDTHYTQFDKLSMLSADVAIIGHHAFNNWLELRGGAGLGVGAVFGAVYTTNDSNQVCTKANAGNIHECYPISNGTPIPLGTPQTNAQLAKTQGPGDDTAQDPHRKKFALPAMGVIDIMMALNFRLHRYAALQVELGFRDAMFAGLQFQSMF